MASLTSFNGPSGVFGGVVYLITAAV